MIANEMVVPEICLEQFTGGRDMEAPRVVMRGAWWGCPVGIGLILLYLKISTKIVKHHKAILCVFYICAAATAKSLHIYLNINKGMF